MKFTLSCLIFIFTLIRKTSQGDHFLLPHERTKTFALTLTRRQQTGNPNTNPQGDFYFGLIIRISLSICTCLHRKYTFTFFSSYSFSNRRLNHWLINCLDISPLSINDSLAYVFLVLNASNRSQTDEAWISIFFSFSRWRNAGGEERWEKQPSGQGWR